MSDPKPTPPSQTPPEACGTCRFGRAKKGTLHIVCVRYPVHVHHLYDSDWCGEWAARLRGEAPGEYRR